MYLYSCMYTPSLCVVPCTAVSENKDFCLSLTRSFLWQKIILSLKNVYSCLRIRKEKFFPRSLRYVSAGRLITIETLEPSHVVVVTVARVGVSSIGQSVVLLTAVKRPRTSVCCTKGRTSDRWQAEKILQSNKDSHIGVPFPPFLAFSLISKPSLVATTVGYLLDKWSFTYIK